MSYKIFLAMYFFLMQLECMPAPAPATPTSPAAPVVADLLAGLQALAAGGGGAAGALPPLNFVNLFAQISIMFTQLLQIIVELKNSVPFTKDDVLNFMNSTIKYITEILSDIEQLKTFFNVIINLAIALIMFVVGLVISFFTYYGAIVYIALYNFYTAYKEIVDVVIAFVNQCIEGLKKEIYDSMDNMKAIAKKLLIAFKNIGLCIVNYCLTFIKSLGSIKKALFTHGPSFFVKISKIIKNYISTFLSSIPGYVVAMITLINGFFVNIGMSLAGAGIQVISNTVYTLLNLTPIKTSILVGILLATVESYTNILYLSLFYNPPEELEIIPYEPAQVLIKLIKPDYSKLLVYTVPVLSATCIYYLAKSVRSITKQIVSSHQKMESLNLVTLDEDNKEIFRYIVARYVISATIVISIPVLLYAIAKWMQK